MQKKSLVELIHELEQEMLRLGYTEASMQFYRRRWQMCFNSHRNGVKPATLKDWESILLKNTSIFSKKISIEHFHRRRPRNCGSSGWWGIFNCTIPFYVGTTSTRKFLRIPFISLSDRFKQYCVDKEYSRVTTDHYVKQSARFMDYLASQKVTNCKEISLTCIHAYIKTLAGYTYKTVNKLFVPYAPFFVFCWKPEKYRLILLRKRRWCKPER